VLYVAITPGYLWSALLLAAWFMVATPGIRRFGLRHPALVSLLVAMAFQAIAAIAVAVATSADSIGRVACLGGGYGRTGTGLLTATQAPAVWLLFTLWPKDAQGTRVGVASWVLAWVVFSAVAAAMFLRSAALCTV
jgi:hypothetical protein